MEPSSAAPSAPLAVHANVRLEINNQVVLSRWRVQLLEAIDGAGSIRAAATQMKTTHHLELHRLYVAEAHAHSAGGDRLLVPR